MAYREVEWHDVATAMRIEGAPTRLIAEVCGISVKHLLYWENGLFDSKVPDESELYEHHVYRTPRQILAGPAAKMAAIKAFAAGEIDRTEMMRRITLAPANDDALVAEAA